MGMENTAVDLPIEEGIFSLANIKVTVWPLRLFLCRYPFVFLCAGDSKRISYLLRFRLGFLYFKSALFFQHSRLLLNILDV